MSSLPRWKFAPRLALFALIGVIMCSGFTIAVALHVIERGVEQRSMRQVDAMLRVAWLLLHKRGTEARIADGRLLVGTTALNDDAGLVTELRQLLGGVAAVFQDDMLIASNAPQWTVRDGMPARLVAGPVHDAVLRDGKPFRGEMEISGAVYFAGYDPIRDAGGQVIGALFTGIPRSRIMDGIRRAQLVVLGVSVSSLLLVGLSLIAIGRSLTGRITRREGDLEAINFRLDTALDSMNQGLCLFDGEHRLIIANRRYAEIYALPPDSLPPGTTLAEVVARRQAAGTGPVTSPGHYLAWRGAIARELSASDTMAQLQDGRRIAIHHQPMPDGGWVATHDDVTNRHLAEARIKFLGDHDDLTGLANRRLLLERMDEALAAGGDIAVLHVDLDRFKAVNDTIGYPAGDALLRAVGLRLTACVTGGDLAARLGSDEFAIIGTASVAPAAVAVLARRIIDALSAPYDRDGVPSVIGASIGIVLASRDCRDREDLLRHADLAVQRAKAGGGGDYCFFEPGMDRAVRQRRMLEGDLRVALAHGEMELQYQPQVDTFSGEVCGFEALMRWHHPRRGLVPPGEFIPIAEDTGAIVELGRWALMQACGEATRWPGAVRVAVNLSPAQFSSPSLVQDIQAALTASDLLPDRLELEVTESLLLADTAGAKAALRAMRALGVRVSLDDFGTGYSSLLTLRSFPFAKIKIDQSFVRDLADEGESRAIVHAVIGLATSLGMTVTAEGVETREQLQLLRLEGCTEVQGYFFDRPMPAACVRNFCYPDGPGVTDMRALHAAADSG